DLAIVAPSELFEGIANPGESLRVWMSHGDRVTRIPEGFDVIGTSANAPFAAIADRSRRLYGLMFHPEVVHTPQGAAIIRNFTHRIAGCGDSWTMGAFRDAMTAKIRAQVGDAKVICGL